MGSFSGTACWRKTFRDSQVQRLRSARIFLFPYQVRDRLQESNGGGSSDADTLKGTRDKMPVGNLLEDIHAQPLPEFDHALLMTGGAEVVPLAGEGQQVFMAAIFAFHTGKPVVQVPPYQVWGRLHRDFEKIKSFYMSRRIYQKYNAYHLPINDFKLLFIHS